MQASITEWLSLLSLAQYETVLLDAGYDDIDFVSEITMEELRDIGITKRGERAAVFLIWHLTANAHVLCGVCVFRAGIRPYFVTLVVAHVVCGMYFSTDSCIWLFQVT